MNVIQYKERERETPRCHPEIRTKGALGTFTAQCRRLDKQKSRPGAGGESAPARHTHRVCVSRRSECSVQYGGHRVVLCVCRPAAQRIEFIVPVLGTLDRIPCDEGLLEVSLYSNSRSITFVLYRITIIKVS